MINIIHRFLSAQQLTVSQYANDGYDDHDIKNKEWIGWLAALGAMVAFGSFGVPMKSHAANMVDVDPLVFQSYKSLVCFVTSWWILVLNSNVTFTFTPWGIVSCIFWVPGGVATVYAIRNAGLAIAIGVGSSSIVLVSFIWGFFIFHEDVHSKLGAFLAILTMMIGLGGMAYYSSPPGMMEVVDATIAEDNAATAGVHDNGANFVAMETMESTEQPHNLQQTSAQTIHIAGESEAITILQSSNSGANEADSLVDDNDDNDNESSILGTNDDTINGSSFQSNFPHQSVASRNITYHRNPMDRIRIYRTFSLTRRQLGIAGALFNGLWGGSIMAPMKLANNSYNGTSTAQQNTQGIHYLISFGIGAAVVTTGLWILRFIYNLFHYHGSVRLAVTALPSFHWKVMWKAGLLSGMLWSTGNFFSLISVHYLGEGVGYSVVQAGMLGTHKPKPNKNDKRNIQCSKSQRSELTI